jgi:hypothetical protein
VEGDSNVEPHDTTDQDVHKGATEDERPPRKGAGRPGLDENGLPNDPTAIGQDVVGANEDHTQG